MAKELQLKPSTSTSFSSALDHRKPDSPPRSYSRPPPITVHPSPSPCPPPPHRATLSPPKPTLIEPLDSPAFLKGDLNFTTFREKAALAIAEWGPSPTRTHFSSTDLRALTPQRNQFNLSPSTSTANNNNSLKAPPTTTTTTTTTPPAQSHLPSPPLTPLTPGPYSRPQHREQSPTTRRSSLKLTKRPRPSPLQLKKTNNNISDTSFHDHIQHFRNVRFADGSPLRGSTWHITQYPARLASPPISAANLSLADLVELEAIKQSLGTWCGEMMGSPMRGSFSHSCASTCSMSISSLSSLDSDSQSTTWLPSLLHTPLPISDSPASSPLEPPPFANPLCQHPLTDHLHLQAWPLSPAYESDCDSEIFEGMH